MSSLQAASFLFDHLDGRLPYIEPVETPKRRIAMDVVYLAALAALFGLVVAFAKGCARLTGGRA